MLSAGWWKIFGRMPDRVKSYAAGNPQELAEQADAATGKENVAQDVAALVSGARRLQPLLAKAERLRRAAKDAPRRHGEVDGAHPLHSP